MINKAKERAEMKNMSVPYNTNKSKLPSIIELKSLVGYQESPTRKNRLVSNKNRRV